MENTWNHQLVIIYDYLWWSMLICADDLMLGFFKSHSCHLLPMISPRSGELVGGITNFIVSSSDHKKLRVGSCGSPWINIQEKCGKPNLSRCGTWSTHAGFSTSNCYFTGWYIMVYHPLILIIDGIPYEFPLLMVYPMNSHYCPKILLKFHSNPTKIPFATWSP